MSLWERTVDEVRCRECGYVERETDARTRSECPRCHAGGAEPMNSLKPCPFCGGKARLIRKPIFSIDGGFMANDGSYHIVVCDTPSCASVGYYGREQEAIEAWNRRVKPGDGKSLTDEEREILNDMPALKKMAMIAGFEVERTCRNVNGGRSFTCSECSGNVFNPWPEVAPLNLHYCPHCGARVVSG